MKHPIVIAFLLNIINMLVPTHLSAQNTTRTDDNRFPFVVITKDSDPAPTITDADFYHRSQGVIFKVNRTEVPVSDPFLKLYRDSVLPWVNSQNLQLRKVFIRGAASPEGPYEGNQVLGRKRSEVLIKLLRRNLTNQYIEVDTQVSSITEDYGYLCLLMAEAEDPDYQTVKDIYDTCQGDEFCCKQKLMAADGGKLWKRLVQEYYPRLRAARVMLWFSEPDDAHAPTPTHTIVARPIVTGSRDTVYVYDTLVVIKETLIGSTLIDRRGRRHGQGLWPGDTIMRHPILALKTNLLFDLATLLNGEIEVPFAKRYSILAECTWPWWLEKKHNKWCVEMGSLGLEGRFWFKKWNQHSTYDEWRKSRRAPLRGWFMGLYAHAGYYDFQLKRHSGSQGEFAGGGISAGYSTYLARNWRMEFSLAAGAAYYKDRKYTVDDNTTADPERDQHLWKNGPEKKSIWFGPTKAKISISYVFTGKCKKGGKR